MDMDTVTRLRDWWIRRLEQVQHAFLLGGPGVEYNTATGEYGTFANSLAIPLGFSADTTGIDAVGIERVIGTDEDDFITGAAGTAAAPAPEEIEGGDGGDTLNGGDGPGDTVSYESSDRRVRVDLEAGGTTAASVIWWSCHR